MQLQIPISESYTTYKDKYKRCNHVVGISMWEFEWCPKYRYRMFRKWEYKKLAEADPDFESYKKDSDFKEIVGPEGA